MIDNQERGRRVDELPEDNSHIQAKAVVAVNKEVFKEAIKEWMDERFAVFGKWTLGTFFALGFGWLVYGLLILGFHR